MYSIWIIPPEPVYSQTKTVISTLSRKYAGPTFEPHLTVLGNIEANVSEIDAILRHVARDYTGLQLAFGSVSFSTTYFQSVFIRINSTSSLMQLYLDLTQALGRENGVFMPHISLLYGDHDMHTREKAAGEVAFPQTRFIATKLTIVPATDNPAEWQHITSIPFGKK